MITKNDVDQALARLVLFKQYESNKFKLLQQYASIIAYGSAPADKLINNKYTVDFCKAFITKQDPLIFDFVSYSAGSTSAFFNSYNNARLITAEKNRDIRKAIKKLNKLLNLNIDIYA